MQGEEVRVGIRFDRETARLLKQLAHRHEGNQSAELRTMIHEEARRRGLSVPTSHEAAGRQYANQGR